MNAVRTLELHVSFSLFNLVQVEQVLFCKLRNPVLNFILNMRLKYCNEICYTFEYFILIHTHFLYCHILVKPVYTHSTAHKIKICWKVKISIWWRWWMFFLVVRDLKLSVRRTKKKLNRLINVTYLLECFRKSMCYL